MSYAYEWYIPYRVMDARVWGEVTTAELEHHADVCVEYLTLARLHNPEGVVNIIFDTLGATHIPPLYLMMSQGIRVMKFKNRGTMYLVANNSAVRSVIEVTARVMREYFPLRIFSTRQEALDALHAAMAKENLTPDP